MPCRPTPRAPSLLSALNRGYSQLRLLKVSEAYRVDQHPHRCGKLAWAAGFAWFRVRVVPARTVLVVRPAFGRPLMQVQKQLILDLAACKTVGQLATALGIDSQLLELLSSDEAMSAGTTTALTRSPSAVATAAALTGSSLNRSTTSSRSHTERSHAA
jgi:hypothetical protein